jgi:hypothetical protein
MKMLRVLRSRSVEKRGAVPEYPGIQGAPGLVLQVK